MPADNGTYPKVEVQWLNQVQFFYQSLCLVESKVFRNRQLRVAAKRCTAFERNVLDTESSNKKDEL